MLGIKFCVLCSGERHGWLNPLLVRSLLALPSDSVTVDLKQDVFPVDAARNQAVIAARDGGYSWLVMCDNDMTLPPAPYGILDVLNNAPDKADVIGFMAGCGDGSKLRMNAHITAWCDDDYIPVEHIGAGVIALRSRVWEKLPRGPWFVTEYHDDELHSIKRGEDIYFADLCNASGLKMYTPRACAGHLKIMDITPPAIQVSFKVPH